MKLFIDTNIILEYLLNREESDNVDQVLLWADEHDCELIISAGAAYTLTYSIDKYLRKESLIYNPERTSHLRNIMKKVFSRYNVKSMDSKGFHLSASDNNFTDLEDSYQWRIALESSCNVLLTLNTKDYFQVNNSSFSLQILSPRDFINRYCLSTK